MSLPDGAHALHTLSSSRFPRRRPSHGAQVLCTSMAWSAAHLPPLGAAVLAEHHVTAEKLGPFKLKGGMDRTELLQCRFTSKPLLNKRRASTFMPAVAEPAGHAGGEGDEEEVEEAEAEGQEEAAAAEEYEGVPPSGPQLLEEGDPAQR